MFQQQHSETDNNGCRPATQVGAGNRAWGVVLLHPVYGTMYAGGDRQVLNNGYDNYVACCPIDVRVKDTECVDNKSSPRITGVGSIGVSRRKQKRPHCVANNCSDGGCPNPQSSNEAKREREREW